MTTGEDEEPATSASTAGDHDDADEESPEPTPQSEALRRQQLLVGSGIAILTGIAVIVAVGQQFPSIPVPAAIVAGMATAGFLLALLLTGIFTGEETE